MKPIRTASCSCGQLSIACAGEPIRVSVCHCLDCKKRSGGAFSAQARWLVRDTQTAGEARTWTRTGDSGSQAIYCFCPICGSNVSYSVDTQPEVVAVPLGGFSPEDRPVPGFSVYEERQESWLAILGDAIERMD